MVKGESRLRVLENKILKPMFGPRGMRVSSGEGSIIGTS